MTPTDTRRNTIAVATVCLSALMFGLEISSVPTILPTLEQVMQADFRQLQWIMNAYTIAVTTVLMATGALADRYGRRRIFIISIVCFGIASLICGLARDASMLIVSRFLQGMSGGAMLICQAAVLSHQFQERAARARAFGAWGIIFGIGLGFGPIIGAAIVAVSSWHWVFLAHVPLAAVTAILGSSALEESRDPQAQKLDIAGIATLSLSVFCLAFYITQGPQLGFASTEAIAIISVAAASFVAFVIAERLSARPMFDFSVFRIRDFSGALAGSVGMNFSFWPFMIYLPIYFQRRLDYDNVAAGLALLAYTLPTLLVPPLAERLALRWRPGVVIPAGLFTIGVGFMLMRFGGNAEHVSWLTMLPGCVLAGIGLGLTNTPVTNTTTGSVASARAGMASGIDMSGRMISLAINIAMMGFVLVSGVKAYLKSALPTDMGAADLHFLAERIAAGTASATTDGAIVHAALAQGFDWVMLYGGIGVCTLAVISWLLFGPQRTEVACESARST